MKNKEKDKKIIEDEKNLQLVKTDCRVFFKTPDNSIYYGFIAYIDQYGNIINDILSLTKEERDKTKIVRHGDGAQIFGFDDTGETLKYTYKYEGNWVKDKLNGKGKLEYLNGDIYMKETLIIINLKMKGSTFGKTKTLMMVIGKTIEWKEKEYFTTEMEQNSKEISFQIISLTKSIYS